MGLVVPWNVGSSPTRDWTRVPCIDSQILNHWTTREALVLANLILSKPILTSSGPSGLVRSNSWDYFRKLRVRTSAKEDFFCPFWFCSLIYHVSSQIYFTFRSNLDKNQSIGHMNWLSSPKWEWLGTKYQMVQCKSCCTRTCHICYLIIICLLQSAVIKSAFKIQVPCYLLVDPFLFLATKRIQDL